MARSSSLWEESGLLDNSRDLARSRLGHLLQIPGYLRGGYLLLGK